MALGEAGDEAVVVREADDGVAVDQEVRDVDAVVLAFLFAWCLLSSTSTLTILLFTCTTFIYRRKYRLDKAFCLS